jgi:hypothetical protein
MHVMCITIDRLVAPTTSSVQTGATTAPKIATTDSTTVAASVRRRVLRLAEPCEQHRGCRQAGARSAVTTAVTTVVCAQLLTRVVAIALTTRWVRRPDDTAVVSAAHACATGRDKTTVIWRAHRGANQVGNRSRHTCDHTPTHSYACSQLF